MRIDIPYIRIILLIPLLFCSGCFPYHFTTRPGASGTVIDAETQAGIQQAAVTLTTYSLRDNKEKLETTFTDEDGFFVIAAEQEWGLYVITMQPEQLKAARLSIQAEGYETYINDFYGTTMGPGIRRFKCIPVRHIPLRRIGMP